MTIDNKLNEPSTFQKILPKTSSYFSELKESLFPKPKPEPVYREITHVLCFPPWDTTEVEPSHEELDKMRKDYLKNKRECSILYNLFRMVVDSYTLSDEEYIRKRQL